MSACDSNACDGDDAPLVDARGFISPAPSRVPAPLFYPPSLQVANEGGDCDGLTHASAAADALEYGGAVDTRGVYRADRNGGGAATDVGE